MAPRIGPAVLGIMLAALLIGCSHSHAGRDRFNDCLDRELQRIRSAPVRSHLDTLDGRQVPLAVMFDQCRRRFPPCVLPRTFYHWRHDVLDIESRSSSGPVRHRIRAYHNLISVCAPERVDPGRTHGDVAEFYDANGTFMGLAVYMGEGLYIALPDPGYPGKALLPPPGQPPQ